MDPIPEFGTLRRVLWRLSWPIARLLAFWFPYSVVRRAPLPNGPYVAAINHLSLLDPPLAGLALKRPMRFLALDELWGNAWILDRMFRAYGAIPLPRERRYPIAALRAALAELASGGAVGVFPEGRRVSEWGDVPLKRGAAWLSMRTGALLVPVAVWGTQNAMPAERMRIRRAPITVVVGEPIDPASFAAHANPLVAMTEAWRSAIHRELTALSQTT